jgi:hypothetical protein
MEEKEHSELYHHVKKRLLVCWFVLASAILAPMAGAEDGKIGQRQYSGGSNLCIVIS